MIFYKCKSLEYLPEITKWNIQKDVKMNNIFKECNSLKSIPDIYKWTFSKLNQKTIIYNIENYDKIKIFGDIFVNINKNNCYLLIDGNKNELCSELKLRKKKMKKNETIQNVKNKLEIKLVETKSIVNMASMFYECKSLVSLPDILYWDISLVNNIGSMFNGCTSLKSLPNISIWDTKNVTDMSSLFNGCKSLESLPDISKWDTKNVTDMGYMFNECISLK